MEEQQGIKTVIVPIGDEHQTLQESQYFHSAFIDNHMYVTIKFQLLEQQHGQFRIRDAQIADKVSTQLYINVMWQAIFNNYSIGSGLILVSKVLLRLPCRDNDDDDDDGDDLNIIQ